MKITYGKIYLMVGDVQGTGALFNLRQQKLPIQTSAKLRRTVRALSPLYEDILEERNRLVTELGKEGENGQPFIEHGTPEAAEFEQQFGDLMRTEIEVDIHPIHARELGNAEVSELDLEILEPILDLEE